MVDFKLFFKVDYFCECGAKLNARVVYEAGVGHECHQYIELGKCSNCIKKILEEMRAVL